MDFLDQTENLSDASKFRQIGWLHDDRLSFVVKQEKRAGNI